MPALEFAMSRAGESFQLTDPDPELRELLWKLVPNGQAGIFTLQRKRNPKFHNLAMSFFRRVFENQDKYDTVEGLMLEVKLRCGHYDEHITVNGNVIYVPRSVSFAEMDELEFQTFMQKAIDVCLRHFCQDWPIEEQQRIATWM